MKKKIRLPIKILGIFALTSIIAIPVLATTSCGDATPTPTTLVQSTTKINSVDTVFDETTKATTLYLLGVDLPSDKVFYKIKNLSNGKQIDMAKVVLTANDKASVNLSFNDTDYVGATNVNNTKLAIPEYEVSIEESGKQIVVGKTSKSFYLPTLSIDVQPTAKTITTSTSEVDLQCTASVKSNSINGEKLSYQWFSSSTNDTKAKWTLINGANTSSYKLLTSSITPGAITYVKCVVSYKYAKSVDSNIVAIDLIKQPNLKIITQPQNQTLNHNATEATFSVGTSLTNPISGKSVTYQWFSSDNSDTSSTATWTKIDSATSETYKTDINSLAVGTKKYYRCEISYKYVQILVSNVAYVERTEKSVLSITTQPQDKTLVSGNKEAKLSVVASVSNQISGQNIHYQWYVSSVDPTPTSSQVIPTPTTPETSPGTSTTSPNVPSPIETPVASSTTNTPSVLARVDTTDATTNVDANWSLISDANASDYTVNLGETPDLWQNKWYRCEVTYTNADKIISSPVCVKMTLTEEKAKTALVTWLKVDSNQKEILTQYLSQTDVAKKSDLYSGGSILSGVNISTLPDFTIKNISVATKTDLPLVIKDDAETSIPWKIELTITTIGKYKTWVTNSFSNEQDIPIGSTIEFYTPFSFGVDRILQSASTMTATTPASMSSRVTSSSSTTTQEVKISFSSVIATGTTTLTWTHTNVQLSTAAYPFKVLKPDSTNLINSCFLRPEGLKNVISTTYKFIPVFNIIANSTENTTNTAQ